MFTTGTLTVVLAVAVALSAPAAAAEAADPRAAERKAADAFLANSYRRAQWRKERAAGDKAGDAGKDKPKVRRATKFACPDGQLHCDIEFEADATTAAPEDTTLAPAPVE